MQGAPWWSLRVFWDLSLAEKSFAAGIASSQLLQGLRWWMQSMAPLLVPISLIATERASRGTSSSPIALRLPSGRWCSRSPSDRSTTPSPRSAIAHFLPNGTLIHAMRMHPKLKPLHPNFEIHMEIELKTIVFGSASKNCMKRDTRKSGFQECISNGSHFITKQGDRPDASSDRSPLLVAIPCHGSVCR